MPRRIRKRHVGIEKTEEEKECLERLKEGLVEEYIREMPGYSREEAREEIEKLWNYDQIIKDVRNYDFTPSGQYSEVTKAMGRISEEFPELYKYLKGNVYVFYSPERVLPERGMFIPQVTKNLDKCSYTILLDSQFVDAGTIDDIETTLLHEAMHLDVRMNPGKYGLKEENLAVTELIGGMEKVINDKIEEETGLERRKINWRKASAYELERPVLKFFACMQGNRCPVGYMKER